MSESPTPPLAAPPAHDSVPWADDARGHACRQWLHAQAGAHGLRPDTLRVASADASFRRYLRLDCADGTTRIVMDAPPEHENCAAFVHVARLAADAGLHVPRVLAWDRAQGFMLLTDLGTRTMMQALDAARPDDARAHYLQALDALLLWQRASRPDALPAYDEALLRRELALFPDWYAQRHRGVALDAAQRQAWEEMAGLIVRRNLAAPRVWVHRDFMPRNLMLAPEADGQTRAKGAPAPLGVLDFQDAVCGPATYDIASLMRDAFISWDEELVLDITVRHWQAARKAGLMDFEDWHADFGSFWRAVEWMGLQRHLKVAGIFARLTLRDGKPKYLADAPRFIAYIRHTAGRYRELAPLLRLVDAIEGTGAASGWAFGRV